MKISKKKVTSAVETAVVEETATSTYGGCVDQLNAAIDCLVDAAEAGDEKAQEAIANISVVILDLIS